MQDVYNPSTSAEFLYPGLFPYQRSTPEVSTAGSRLNRSVPIASSCLPAPPSCCPSTTARAALSFAVHKPLSHLRRIIRNRHTLRVRATGFFLCQSKPDCIAADSRRQSSGHVQTTVVVVVPRWVGITGYTAQTSWRICGPLLTAVAKWRLLSFAR